jgi:hypothetical protein
MRVRDGTVLTQDIQFIVDDAGMKVRGKRKTPAGDVWEERVRIRWSAVTGLGFSIGSHDPVIALYAWAAAGKPHYVADSRALDHLQWTQLGELIARGNVRQADPLTWLSATIPDPYGQIGDGGCNHEGFPGVNRVISRFL